MTTREAERTEQTKPTDLVDQFLERHGTVLPGHIIDFALDVRAAISDLEEELERLRSPEPIG